MTKTTRTLALFLFVITSAFAQDPQIEWQNTIGGSGFERFTSLTQTSDGGYMLGGWSDSDISGDKTENSNGGFDFWIVKIDENGSIEWQNSIGGSAGDALAEAVETTDGGYILGGDSFSDISGDKTENVVGGKDYWIVKVDMSGNIQWQNTIGGSLDDDVRDIIQTSDGGYLVGGYSISDISGDKTENSFGERDYWVLKLDASGDIEWQRTIGGDDFDDLIEVEQTTDGGYILGGMSSSTISGNKTEASNGAMDFWVVKLDTSGNIVWQNSIGGSEGDSLLSITQTSDGGYITGGTSWSDISGDKTENSNGESDFWVVKLNSSGEIEWQNTIGGSSFEELEDVTETIDGGYIIAGNSYSDISGDKTENSFGDADYWVIRLDNTGEILWQNTIGGSGFEEVRNVIQTPDGNYLIGGYSDSDISGDKDENSNGGNDYWVVKLTEILSVGDVTDTNTIRIYPNPATDILEITTQSTIKKLKILDVLGATVMKFSPGKTFRSIDISSLNSGSYFILIENINGTLVKKFIKQ